VHSREDAQCPSGPAPGIRSRHQPLNTDNCSVRHGGREKEEEEEEEEVEEKTHEPVKIIGAQTGTARRAKILTLCARPFF
jgi:hypothetical protein